METDKSSVFQLQELHGPNGCTPHQQSSDSTAEGRTALRPERQAVLAQYLFPGLPMNIAAPFLPPVSSTSQGQPSEALLRPVMPLGYPADLPPFPLPRPTNRQPANLELTTQPPKNRASSPYPLALNPFLSPLPVQETAAVNLGSQTPNRAPLPAALASQLAISDFTGDTKESFCDWLFTFKQWVEVHGAPEQEMSRILLLRLGGSALRWIRTFDKASSMPFPELVTFLEQQFSTPSFKLSEELKTLKINEGETAAEFMRRARKAVTDTLPGCTEEHFMTLLRCALGQGLQNRPEFQPIMRQIFSNKTEHDLRMTLESAEFYHENQTTVQNGDQDEVPRPKADVPDTSTVNDLSKNETIPPDHCIVQQQGHVSNTGDPWVDRYPPCDANGNRMCTFCGNKGHSRLRCRFWREHFKHHPLVIPKLREIKRRKELKQRKFQQIPTLVTTRP